jgi:CheY-like chemotaxis protein
MKNTDAKNILIVEDEDDIRESLQEVLGSEGYNVNVASNGKEALEMLNSIPTPDLILLDLLMPEMNGMEFREKQMQMEKFSNIPVVVMSADNYAKQKAKKMHAGFLKKPFELSDLFMKINEGKGDL